MLACSLGNPRLRSLTEEAGETGGKSVMGRDSAHTPREPRFLRLSRATLPFRIGLVMNVLAHTPVRGIYSLP